MTHKKLWDAVEKIAKDHNMTTPELAIAIGINPTAFDKSKRFDKNGRERWLSMRTIAQICDVLKMDFADFIKYL